MKKPLYEIFDEFALLKTEKERISFLKKFYEKEFCQVMKIVFFTDFGWLVSDYPPKFRSSGNIAGISYTNYAVELPKLHYLVNHPGNSLREPRNVKKLHNFWEGILGRLEPREAEVFVNIIKRDLKVPNLTRELLLKTFPGIDTWQA